MLFLRGDLLTERGRGGCCCQNSRMILLELHDTVRSFVVYYFCMKNGGERGRGERRERKEETCHKLCTLLYFAKKNKNEEGTNRTTVVITLVHEGVQSNVG